MTSLSRCPFCGGDAKSLNASNLAFVIRCEKCLCRTGNERCEEDAISAWNTRALSAPDVERTVGDAHRLATALQKLVDRYVALVNSGDCGFWNPEDEPEIAEARAALAPAGGSKWEPFDSEDAAIDDAYENAVRDNGIWGEP